MADDRPARESAGGGMNVNPGTCSICGCKQGTPCFDELRGYCWWVVGTHLCSHCAQPDPRRSLALVASEGLAEAAAEMIRFSREGCQETFEPFALDPARSVAESLIAILRIELASEEKALEGGYEYPCHNQLVGALQKFLEDTA